MSLFLHLVVFSGFNQSYVFLGLPSSFFRPSPDRNQFRVQLTGVIECTAVLFEHLVELTQGLDEVGCFDMGALLISLYNIWFTLESFLS